MAKRFGVMLDMSRNAVMKPSEVKKFALTLKKLGYNMIQLYTEDTYEIPEEPYFGYLRGRYTQAELKDIVNYCNGIGVEVIPNIQTLAHLKQIFKWHEYVNINDTGDIMLVGEERTYTLIENMFRSLRESFTTDYIHIGMDEAHMLGLGAYKYKHGIRNRFDIIYEHLKRVLEIAKKYNFKPIMWSDMFFRLANNDRYYTNDPDVITDEVVAACPEGVELVYWDYYSTDKTHYDNMITAHKKFGRDTWFAGGAWTWKGLVPDNKFTIDSMTPAMKSCKEGGVENIFLTMWGDDGKECSFYALLPSLYTVRRLYDGEEDIEKIKGEFKEITGFDYDDIKAFDMGIEVGEEKQKSPTKFMLYTDPFFGFIDPISKENAPEVYARLRDKFLPLADKGELGYLFAHYAALCDLLTVKHSLGIRTRAAYEKGDKAAIKAIAEDYTVCAEKAKVFLKKFRTLWYTENKPNGFEIQEYRLGGLICRLEALKERLLDYANGKIESLPELEEKILEYNNWAKSGIWSTVATVNVVSHV